MSIPILNVADVEFEERHVALQPAGPAAERYAARIGAVGARLGARKLGYNITAVPPGKRAFPFHNHHVNEEMAFILQGSGEVRIGAQVYPVRAGDVIAFPPGGPETAHQIINTGSEEMRYLAVSTRLSPEVGEYPDSGKFGLLEDLPPGEDGQPRRFFFLGRPGESLNYWEGE